jgi:hypothetical protein
MPGGTVIYEAHPAMFRAHPFWFIGGVILVPVFGLGVLLLLYRYIHTRQTALTVTDTEIPYERGILSKDRTSVLVMTIVSGGDAIFGELPFTIAGFLIFFVIFWLMIAWIF